MKRILFILTFLSWFSAFSQKNILVRTPFPDTTHLVGAGAGIPSFWFSNDSLYLKAISGSSGIIPTRAADSTITLTGDTTILMFLSGAQTITGPKTYTGNIVTNGVLTTNNIVKLSGISLGLLPLNYQLAVIDTTSGAGARVYRLPLSALANGFTASGNYIVSALGDSVGINMTTPTAPFSVTGSEKQIFTNSTAGLSTNLTANTITVTQAAPLNGAVGGTLTGLQLTGTANSGDSVSMTLIAVGISNPVGKIPSYTGINIGGGSLANVTSYHGIVINDESSSVGASGITGQMSSGSGKTNINITGTATNNLGPALLITGAGYEDASIQIGSNATTNDTVLQTVQTLYEDPSSLLASKTVYLPLPANINQGHYVKIFIGGQVASGSTAITSFTVTTVSGQSIIGTAISGVAAVSGQAPIIYQYRYTSSSAGKYYRIQ